jgi:ferritin-like metal-binding protein YciE
LLTGLRNQHAVENQAISLLSRQVERLERYPEMEARMRQYIDESKAQESRLEEVPASMGSSHSALKDVGLSLTGNVVALMHS